jgi:pimeloyl-ACP methyl ester carboxylesterase
VKCPAVVFLLFLLLTAGCVSTSTAPSTRVIPDSTVTTVATTASTVGSGPVSSSPAVGDLEPVDDCFGDGIQALGTRCGYVTVPLDYDDPGAGTIRIATIFVDNGAGDRPPLMYFPGGPGASAVDLALAFYGQPFDVLLMDERGVGASEPSLNCTEVDALFLHNLTEPEMDRFTGSAHTSALKACRARIVGDGVDLDAFGSDRSARDIGVVSRALGFDEVDIWAVSGGARLALTKLRDDPVGIRSLILDSVVPVDVNIEETHTANAARSIDLMSQGCASQPECADRVGDVWTLLELLKSRFDAEPVTLTVNLPTGSTGEVLLDGDTVVLLTIEALYRRELIPTVPSRLTSAANGDLDGLARVLETAMERDFSEGMFLSVLCREEHPFNDPDTVAIARSETPVLAAWTDNLKENCAVWNIGAAGPIENEPVANPLDIPMLVFAGAFDPVTPPAWSRLVAARLGGTYVEVPDGGHAVALANTCTTQIFLSFLADPATPPDTACVDGLEPPMFRGFNG